MNLGPLSPTTPSILTENIIGHEYIRLSRECVLFVAAEWGPGRSPVASQTPLRSPALPAAGTVVRVVGGTPPGSPPTGSPSEVGNGRLFSPHTPSVPLFSPHTPEPEPVTNSAGTTVGTWVTWSSQPAQRALARHSTAVEGAVQMPPSWPFELD